jgi:glycine/D-amino acid oxidase-like deaminating enzyme
MANSGEFAVEKLAAAETRMHESCVAPSLSGALRFPLDIQVENRRVLSAWQTASPNWNPDVVRHQRRVIEKQHGRVKGIQTNDGFIACQTVVIATGAWTSFLSSSVKIEPIRGQMVCLTAAPNSPGHVIYSPRGYLIPRQDAGCSLDPQVNKPAIKRK